MVNMQMAFLSPPFGYSLFYLKSVAPPQISMAMIFRSAIPFIGLAEGYALAAIRRTGVSLQRIRPALERLNNGKLTVTVLDKDGRTVNGADIVCCCTTSGEPLFDGTQLPPGCHVNAIGSYQPHTREIDTATITGSRFVVDDVDAVLAEAGDVQIPIAEGAFSAESIAGDLQSVIAGRSVRQSPADITVFKSVGFALEDVQNWAGTFSGSGTLSIPGYRRRTAALGASTLGPEQLATFVELLSESQRPLIYAGGGVILDDKGRIRQEDLVRKANCKYTTFSTLFEKNLNWNQVPSLAA